MSDSQRPTSKVTLEDLLRVKRAERPGPEFWVEFERSMRAKQLAAIVDKRPWWRSWNGLSRWSIPLGAAAALTVTIATLNRTHTPSRVPQITKVENAPTIVQERPAPPEVASVQTISPAPAPAVVQEPAATSIAPAPVQTEVVRTTAVASAPVPTRLPSVSEQIAGIGVDANETEHTSARFASVVQKDSAADGLTQYFDHAVARLDSNLRPEKTPMVEPLAQVTSPRDARRARLLAYLSSVENHSAQAADSSTLTRRRERVASHLSEDALYDSIRRLGIKDGGVSIQF